ncbi:hypothetical protein LTR85_010043 [Meristemomyces frigidus]|nr:hypothetical protein LTR85_010043 [Meristemomyces frigidus]
MSTSAKSKAEGVKDEVQDVKHDVFSLGIHAELPVESLYRPIMVTIQVGSPPQEFQAPRGLICGQSAYFERAFNERFAEGRANSTSLPEVECWVFEVFIAWLYTQRLSPARRDSLIPSLAKTTRTATRRPKFNVASETTGFHVAYQALVELYVFGDRYDTRNFRRTVIEYIQIKAFQVQPHKYSAPDIYSLKLAFTSLPPECQLYQFFFDLLTWDTRAMQKASVYATLPAEVLAASWLRLQQIRDRNRCERRDAHAGHQCGGNDCERCKSKPACDDPCHGSVTVPKYHTDLHAHHEHETEEERSLCVKRWEVIIEHRWPSEGSDAVDADSQSVT